eukprot:15692-Heterococcus_DN1.PRE.4
MTCCTHVATGGAYRSGLMNPGTTCAMPSKGVPSTATGAGVGATTTAAVSCTPKKLSQLLEGKQTVSVWEPLGRVTCAFAAKALAGLHVPVVVCVCMCAIHNSSK